MFSKRGDLTVYWCLWVYFTNTNWFLTSDKHCWWRPMWIPTKTQAKSSGGKTCGRDKFGFVATGSHNEAMIKLLSMVCVCVCLCVRVWVLCFRSEDVDKLSDPGKQHPQPKSIFDFEPGKSTASESRSQVRPHMQSQFQNSTWYHSDPAENNISALLFNL